jgi:hypothetical protein
LEKSFKILSRIRKPISIKFKTDHSLVKGIKIYSYKVQILFKGEITTKCMKLWYGVTCLLLENQWTRKACIYMKASWHSANLYLLISWSQGFGLGHDTETIFRYVYIGKSFKNVLLKHNWGSKIQIYIKASSYCAKSKC